LRALRAAGNPRRLARQSTGAIAANTTPCPRPRAASFAGVAAPAGADPGARTRPPDPPGHGGRCENLGVGLAVERRGSRTPDRQWYKEPPMTLLIIGLAGFIGIHSLPWFPTLRAALIARLGERAYRRRFALVALTSLGLMVLGKARAEFVPLYTPPAWGHQAALPLVLLAFLLLAASQLPSNIKRYTRHPMLWAVTLWSTAHLLANGDLAGVLLFGSLLGYSLAAMYSANIRGARLRTARYPATQDLRAAVAGGIVYIALLELHPYLFGPRVI
jgi:uncharacterized membrane protein